MGAPGFPSIKAGVRVRELSLSAEEGFVIGMIDGQTSPSDIADTMGCPESLVLNALEKLKSIAAIEWDNGTTSAVSPPKAEGQPELAFDPRDLDEDVELSTERKIEILTALAGIEDKTHYEALGIPRDADKKAVRKAYFSKSKRFHPDKSFGKKLGSFKQKMEAIFSRLTEAHNVLGNKRARAEYDEYLSAVDLTRGASALLESEPPLSPEVAMAEAAQQQPQVEAKATQPKSTPTPSVSSKKVSKAPTQRRSEEERKRIARQLLMKRLGGGRSARPPKRASQVAPKGHETSEVNMASRLQGLASSLKRTASVTGGRDQAQQQLAIANSAEKKGDLPTAVNALRLALAMAPDDVEIESRYQSLRFELARSLAESYRKQAVYEEKEEKWSAAALAWSKVAEGCPNESEPRIRVAETLLKESGDLKRARDFAQAGVNLDPEGIRPRIVLIRVYIAAGMAASAKTELVELRNLDPKPEIVKNLELEIKNA